MLKIALLTADRIYGKRLSDSLNSRYHDNLEIALFSQQTTALEKLASVRMDVFLAEESFRDLPEELPGHAAFAWLTEEPAVGNDRPAISKYQKLDDIYKAILDVYQKGGGAKNFLTSSSTSILVFASPAGGCGSSTAAAACALHFAARRHNVLYVNCEPFGTEQTFFPAGDQGLSEILFDIRSKKGAALSNIKLESMAVKAASGVSSLHAFDPMQDLVDVKGEDVEVFLRFLRDSSQYSVVIFDTALLPKDALLTLLDGADAVVSALDGTVRARDKMAQAYRYLETYENRSGKSILSKLHILYNRVSAKQENFGGSASWSVLGTLPPVQGSSAGQIAEYLSQNPAFSSLPAGKESGNG